MKCKIPGGFYDLGNSGGIHVTGNQNESATTHQRKGQNNSKRESQYEK
jgi:hypothetical protein